MPAPARQQSLTALFRVRPSEAVAFGERLRELDGSVRARLAAVASLHEARFVLVPERSNAGTASSILFAATFDGELEAHLGELGHAAGPELGEIFARCEDWDAGAGVGGLARFVGAHLRPAAARFSAYAELGVTDLLEGARLRAALVRFLDEHAGELRALAPSEIVARARAGLEAQGVLGGSRERVASRDEGERAVAGAAVEEVLSRHALGLAGAFLRSALHDFGDYAGGLWRDERQEFASEPAPSPLGVTDGGGPGVLSHLAVLKPGAFRRAALRAALRLLGELADEATRAGRLAGVESLHAARWVLLEDGRLVFLGRYDGSLDALVGAFADRAASALGFVWSHTERFPAELGWLVGGARDEARLRRWVRAGLVPTPIAYSAYPELGAREAQDNAELQRLLSREGGESEARRLLALLRD